MLMCQRAQKSYPAHITLPAHIAAFEDTMLCDDTTT